MKPSLTHVSNIRFNIYDKHPEKGDYCVIGDGKIENIFLSELELLFVQDIKNMENEDYVMCKAFGGPVLLKDCWKVDIEIFG